MNRTVELRIYKNALRKAVIEIQRLNQIYEPHIILDSIEEECNWFIEEALKEENKGK